MKPADRQAFILKYLRARTQSDSSPYRVDVLDSSFVWDYIEHTDAKCAVMPYGAPKCPQLGRDLSALFDSNKLRRSSTGLEGMAGMGFPRWVYSYYL